MHRRHSKKYLTRKNVNFYRIRFRYYNHRTYSAQQSKNHAQIIIIRTTERDF